MRSHPGFVVRSLCPQQARSELVTARTASDAAHESVLAYVASHFPDLEPRFFRAFSGSWSFCGLAAKEGWTSSVTPPAGLRYDKSDKLLVPAKRTDEGKQYARDWAALGFRFPKIVGLGGIVHATDSEPGAPSHLRQSYFTGWTWFDFGENGFFAGIGPRFMDEKSQERVIDEDGTWERAPLSEFHLAQEAAA